MASGLDDALRRIATLTEQYDVNDRVVSIFTDQVASAPDSERPAVAQHLLLDMVLLAASTHRVTCPGFCATCKTFQTAVAQAAGVIRAEVDLRLRAMLAA
jgi:hypothetical protein